MIRLCGLSSWPSFCSFPQATENSEVSSSEFDSSQGEGVGTDGEDNAEAGKSGIETSSDEQEASDGEDKQQCLHTQDTWY